MRLLLAEDEKALSRALVAILERSSYSVDAVFDGQTALEYLESEEYDGVILDVMMPRLDGFEVLKALRQAGNLVPVLMLTAKSEVDDKVLGLDLGENEWINDIQEQSRRLAALTNDLILLSRLEEDNTQMQLLDFPISDVAEEVAHSFQALAITQKKEFSVSIQPMLTLCGDEKMIRQLLMILLDNALKYAQTGGRISLTLEKAGKALNLSVFNTTEHIEKAQLPCLFDRFYRTDRSRNSQTGGHGLGLSIAAAITAAHKGKITASTEDEKSLRIQVSLPA